MTDIVEREQAASLTVEGMRSQVNLIQQVMNSVMKSGQHYGTIPGCGDKPTLFKSGAEKIALTFRLRPIIGRDDVIVEDMGNGHRNYTVYCHILNMDGIELATGVGSCSTMESKYRYRGGMKEGTGTPVPKEYWNLKNEGKLSDAMELIGGRGFGVGKIDGQWEICETGEKQENPDIADVYNTVFKIGKKRAYIDGTLSATAASDIFTQDIEDLPAGSVLHTTPPKTQAPKQKPPRKTKPVESKSPKPTPPQETTEHPANAQNIISDPQRKRLYAIYKTAGYTDDEAKQTIGHFGFTSSKDITKDKYKEICEFFEGAVKGQDA